MLDLDYSELLGREVSFVPLAVQSRGLGPMPRVRGRITYIHPAHGWFTVTYEAGGYTFRESWKFVDIGKEVTLCGRR